MTFGVYSRTERSVRLGERKTLNSGRTVFRYCDLLDLDDIIGNDVFCPAFDLDRRFPKKKSEPLSLLPKMGVSSLLLFQLCLEFGEFLLGIASDDSLDGLGVLLELHSEGFSNELDIEFLVNVRFRQAFLDNELLLGFVRVHSQIVGTSVRTTDTFDPSVRRLDFEIPTVL